MALFLEAIIVGLTGLASSGSSFSLGVEEDGGDRWAEIVLGSEASSAEMVSHGRRVHSLSSFLFEENENKPVNPYVRPCICCSWNVRYYPEN
ncbi:unnamed protein product [Camellia sinensis]